jgi:hypothetical protein
MKKVNFLFSLMCLLALCNHTSAQSSNQLFLIGEGHFGLLGYSASDPVIFLRNAQIYGLASGIKFQRVTSNNLVLGASFGYTQEILTYNQPLNFRDELNRTSFTVDGESSQNLLVQIELGYHWRINRQQHFLLTGSLLYRHLLNNAFQANGDASSYEDPVALAESLAGIGINPYWQTAFKKGNSFGLSFGLPIRYLIDENSNGDLQLGLEVGISYRF